MNPDELRQQVIRVLRKIYDPEMPVNIYELGLIYSVSVDGAGRVSIKMTLTAPNCPVAGTLAAEVKAKISAIPGVTDTDLQIVFDPPWDRSMISEAARLELGLVDIIPIGQIRR
jgi:FeS assembly SUF system protein